MKKTGFWRRSFLKTGFVAASAAGFIPEVLKASGAWAAATQSGAGSTGAQTTPPDIMNRLAQYILDAGGKPLPENVTEKGKHHILDTLAAMVSGSRLKAGVLATKFARTQGGTPEAQVIGAAPIIEKVWALEKAQSMRELRPLLSA
jgi:hypothetical protein